VYRKAAGRCCVGEGLVSVYVLHSYTASLTLFQKLNPLSALQHSKKKSTGEEFFDLFHLYWPVETIVIDRTQASLHLYRPIETIVTIVSIGRYK
jgi:hypothetical protein